LNGAVLKTTDGGKTWINHFLGPPPISSIYFIDSTNIEYNPWGGSKKLKVTLSDQSFIDLYFPGANIKAIYSFENNIKPKNSFVVKSIDILMGQ